MPRQREAGRSTSLSPVGPSRLPVIKTGINSNRFASANVASIRTILERMDRINSLESKKKSFYEPIPEAPMNDLQNCKRKIGSWDTRVQHRYADVLGADVFHNLELERMEALRADRQEQLRNTSVSPTELRFPKSPTRKAGQAMASPPILGRRSRHDPYKGWTKSKDPISKRFYYFHLPTGKSSWTPPPEFTEDYNAWLAYQKAQQELEAAMASEESGESGESGDSECDEEGLESIAEAHEAGTSMGPLALEEGLEAIAELPEVGTSQIDTEAGPEQDASAAPPDDDNSDKAVAEAHRRNSSTAMRGAGSFDLQAGGESSQMETKTSQRRTSTISGISRTPSGGSGQTGRSRRRSSVAGSRRRRSSVLKKSRGPPTPDMAAIAMQKHIRRWLAQKLARKKLAIMERWELVVHKYPPMVYKIQAQSIRVPTDQLISKATSQQKHTEEMALEVHKLVSHLLKGPAGSTEDLRSAEYALDMEAVGASVVDKQPAFPDFSSFTSH